MWFVPPNQGMKCARISVVEPGYSSDRTGTLLTFPAAIFPLTDVLNVLAALVLFAVSLDSVVSGQNSVPAKAGTARRANMSVRMTDCNGPPAGHVPDHLVAAQIQRTALRPNLQITFVTA
jgi:hypothetical protein